ncbi:SigE family RNA polymerase sigma factor [Micromonospora sp. NBC_01392]|uniref:SigE family RNA polymerase sigma factor n=1 Tax=Micromonospora sp. NBC_01392 TaxID=2903588 RepID=UPI00324E0D52
MASRDPLEEEFREFVAARSGALLRTAYLLAGDWATAEDLLQTALTKTYLAWKRLGGIDAIEPYARRVLVNTSTSWWRRRWHGERPTEVLPERAGVDEIEHQLDRDALWRHLQALPARQRAVLVLRFYEDMSEAQTAALLEISPGTVKSQTSRALNTLRRRLGSEAALGLPGEPAPAPAPAPTTPRVLPAPAGPRVGRAPAARQPVVPPTSRLPAGSARQPAASRPARRPAGSTPSSVETSTPRLPAGSTREPAAPAAPPAATAPAPVRPAAPIPAETR